MEWADNCQFHPSVHPNWLLNHLCFVNIHTLTLALARLITISHGRPAGSSRKQHHHHHIGMNKNRHSRPHLLLLLLLISLLFLRLSIAHHAIVMWMSSITCSDEPWSSVWQRVVVMVKQSSISTGNNSYILVSAEYASSCALAVHASTMRLHVPEICLQ